MAFEVRTDAPWDDIEWLQARIYVLERVGDSKDKLIQDLEKLLLEMGERDG